MQFYPGDWWRANDVKGCSMSTQGVWINLLFAMWDELEQGKIRDTRQGICRITGCTKSELDEFVDDNNSHKFANVTFRNDKVTITNRRMHDAYLAKQAGLRRVQKHRKWKRNTKVTPPSSSSTSSSNISKDILSIPALQEVIDFGIISGYTKEQAEHFYRHYKSQGWKKGNGQPITDWQDLLVDWRVNEHKFKDKKQSPQPALGKFCYRCGSSERYDGRTGVIWREKLPWCTTTCYEKWVTEGRPKYD